VTIFTIMKETGVAPKELADTTRKDIDTEQGILRVRGVKGHDSGTYKLKPHTINETAKGISKDYKSSWIAFKKLEKKGLIKKAKRKYRLGNVSPDRKSVV
jgi:hypothetical protein